MRLMKLAFLASRRLAEESICALGVGFYRWKFGPFSNEVARAWERLAAADLIEEEEVWSLTRTGAELATAFDEDVLRAEANAPVREVFDELRDQWRNTYSAQPLLSHIYELSASIEGGGHTIKEMALGEEFETPPTRSQARSSLIVANAWIETFALELNPNSIRMLNAAVEDFRAGRFFVA